MTNSKRVLQEELNLFIQLAKSGVEIHVPLGPVSDPAAYVKQHVDVWLSPTQGAGLKRLLSGLVAAHAVLPKDSSAPYGRHVQTHADAVRWMFESIGEKLDAAPPAGKEN